MKRLTLKEMQAKEYPFFESDIHGMFEELLKAKLIELPEPKRLEESNRSTEPDYCKYHQVLRHSIEKCFVFKEKVMGLARQGAILLEEDKVSTNHVTHTILKKSEVKEPEDFWKSKLESGMKLGDYPSDSESEDIVELCHMYMEVEDTPEVETTSEAHRTAYGVPQSFTIIFTDEDIPEEDDEQNASGWRLSSEHSSSSHTQVVGHLNGRPVADSCHDTRLQPGRSTSNGLGIHPPGDRRTRDNVTVPSDRLQGHLQRTAGKTMDQQQQCSTLHSTSVPKPTERLEAPKAIQPSHPDKEIEVIETLKGLMLQLTQAEKVASTMLKGFMTPVQGSKIEHGTMNPKAYDLLVKAGYDPMKDATMSRSTPEVKVHGLNETQEKLQRKFYSIKSSTAGLEYISKPPLRVMIKRVANYHITEVDQGLCTHPEAATRKSLFQRLGATLTIPKGCQQRSVFQRLGGNSKNPTQLVSIFQRLGEIKHRKHEEPPYHQKRARMQTPCEPEAPEDSGEPRDSRG
ncbi:hypothetical protein LIER_39527 [Lithospermum erythrorhizon]|uniref:Retrotransposon gag domain-containing protein n=1 Tax=Lithospermum erythrorhizon TaxID=34254 RepID=A0AAV3QHC1_LITER